MAVRPLQTQLEPLPRGVRQELPNPLIPWGISDRVFGALKPADSQDLYRRACILPTDPEGLFILRCFAHDRPTMWSIRRIHCIHSRTLTAAFETQLRTMEQETVKFPPTWNTEPQATQRVAVIERWKRATDPFSPFQVMESDGRRVQFDKTRILPLWHGTEKKLCESIAQTGFTYFGKVALAGDATGSTDEGFFGSGIYFTNSARYSADIYSDGNLLLSWVSMREPFPVVHDGATPLCSDMRTLQGKGAYKNYNAHYVPVTADPPLSNTAHYYPCKATEQPLCDEVVVFQPNQTLPRYWIELQFDHPTLLTPSGPPQFVSQLMPPLFRLLERDDVHTDLKLRKIFCELLARLLQVAPEDDLDDPSLVLAAQIPKLIDSAGKIDKAIRNSITGTSRVRPEAPPPDPVVPTLLPSSPVSPSTVSSGAFGKKLWETYFGDVGVEPSLPPDIEAILNAPCPIWSGKKVYETHLLTLIPQTINGKPLTLKLLGELIQKPLQGNATKYGYFDLGQYKDLPAPASHWALMTRDVLPGSRNKTYTDQQALVPRPYAVPSVLDATVAIALEYARTGQRLYGDKPWTYTRCQEKYDNNWQLAVGGFAPAGLDVHHDFWGCDDGGVGAWRKF